MDTRFLRSEICRVGRSLFERGYVHATAGNLSVRLPTEQGGGMLITPTDACLGFLQPDALAWVDDAGTQRSGEPASKTVVLHRRVYAADPQAHCVLHTHSTHLVQLSLQGVWREDDILPPITPYFVMMVGHVPLVPYRRPGDPATADAVADRISLATARGRPIRAVLLDRLGPLVWAAVVDLLGWGRTSALLILAGFGSLKPRALARSWQTSKSSGAAALVTMVATLLVPIHIAVLIGVILTLLLVGINSASTTHIVTLEPGHSIDIGSGI